MERKILHQSRGYKTRDGAGVSLIRVLGSETVSEYDPILLLDSFDSVNPKDYTAGFPLHPHRGIETISYVFRGQMTHRDSLGNEDTIGDGEVQWMTAGSGIMHEEKLPASERLLGVQLWLNLPAKDKMMIPAYRSIKNSEIEEIRFADGKIRLLAGEYHSKKGFTGPSLPFDYYDIHLNANTQMTIETDNHRSVMIFTLAGEVYTGGDRINEKTAVRFSLGDSLTIKAGDKPVQILFVSSVAVKEPVAWGGPIVMNTNEELENAFDELRKGRFLREKISY